MTNYALLYDPGPSGILPGAATMAISGGGLTAGPSTTGDTIVQANAGAPMAAGSGCFCWSVNVGSASLTGYSGPGFISSSYSNTNAMCVGAVQCNVMLTNGSFYAAGGAPFYSPGLATGDTFDFAVNLLCSPPLVWLRRTASGAGSAGQWNGSSTAAPSNSPSATAAGTGGFAISSVTFPIVVAVCFNNGATASYTFNFGASSYTWPMPSGFSNVPPNPVLEITSILSTVGSPTQIGWADTNGGTASGLNYSLNGGAFTACGGTVSGISGTATGPTIGSNGSNFLVLQDASNPLNCTAKTFFPALTTPSGAGTLLASTAFSITQPGSEYSVIGSLSAANPTIIFEWGMNEQCSVTGTTNGAPSLALGGETSTSTTFNTTFPGNWVATDGTAGQQFGVSGVSPTTGPTSVPISLTTSVTGTLSVAGGHFNATISNNGTTVTYVNDSGSGVYNTWEIGFGVMYPSVPAVTMTTYLGIWAPLAPETLSITSASYAFGTLSIGGQVENAVLTTLSVSTNSGATFLSAGSLTVTAPNYEAELYGPLPSATYTLQTKDATTGTVSNLYDLTISNGETIYLGTATGTLGGTLSLTGTYSNGIPTGLNYTLDAVMGATYTPTSNYEHGDFSPLGDWTASGGTLSTVGTFPVAVQDSVNGAIVSNIVDLIVSPPPEELILTSATGTYGGIIMVTGQDLYGPAASLDIRAGSNWQTLGDYVTSGGTNTATFSGVGPIVTTYGIIPVQVRVSANTAILSNILNINNPAPPPPPPPPYTPQLWPGADFPSTSLTTTLRSYLYQEYNDDAYMQSFVAAYNSMTQWFLNYMNALNLPVYTAPNINGALLDWVALGLYGLTRPVLPSGTSKTIGPLNTWELNTIKLDFRETIGPTQVFQTTDDIFKRIITWSFYKGDGFNFSIAWLKRRVMRFLYGVNGTDFIIDRTYPVSVSFGTDYQVDITLVNGEATVKSGAFLNSFELNTIKLNSLVSVFVPVSTPPLGPVLQSAINAGVLPLPFQYTYVVTI